MMGRLRVLVVDDSLTVRKRMAAILAEDGECEVVGEAADGKQAIALCEGLRPDVMTLDMVLPDIAGLAVTEHVMAYCPTPILIVSASMNRGETFQTFDALEAGAVDVLDKPRGDAFGGPWERALVAAVKLVARVPVISHPRIRIAARVRSTPLPPPAPDPEERPPTRLVTLGASTGGPSAVAAVLAGLPRNFPVPVVLVAHIQDAFLRPLVDWLDARSPIPVRVARDGERLAPPEPGMVLAPANRHLVVELGRLRLTDGPERHSCRPSVDVLFESVAKELGPCALGCLLTGMGRDGASGLLAMRRAGATTIAQDEATSSVYGMPREAVEMGAAQHVLPIDRIGAAIARRARGG
jgi:two-component system chemotaxis response regulator CheB